MSTRPSSGNEERRSAVPSLPRVLYHGLFFSGDAYYTTVFFAELTGLV